MNILNPVLRNPFRKRDITKPRLRIFAQHHLEVLTGQNESGQFDTMISETTTAYINFFDRLTGEFSDLAIQKAKTQIVNSIIAQFRDKVHRDHPVIATKYYKDKPEYLEFFPHGLDEYNRISKTKFQIIIERFLSALTTYQGGILTADMINDYTAISDNYVLAHASQSDKKSDVSTNKIEGNLMRVELEDQLFKNLHSLAALYYKTPDQVRIFFDTSKLFAKHRSQKNDNDKKAKDTANLT